MITGFSHVQLIVSDVGKSADWYQRALCMEQFTGGTFAGGEYAGLRSRSGGFVIGLQSAQPDQPASPAAGSIEHLSFAVADRDTLVRRRDLRGGDQLEPAPSRSGRPADRADRTQTAPRLTPDFGIQGGVARSVVTRCGRR